MPALNTFCAALYLRVCARVRFVQAHVVRLLRRRSDAEQVKKGQKLPMVTLKELQEAFSGMAIADSADNIARMLTE